MFQAHPWSQPYLKKPFYCRITFRSQDLGTRSAHCYRDVMAAAAAAKSLQSCPTLCNPIDGSPSGSTVPGILHARTLEWVAISFSNEWKWKVKVKLLSHVRFLVTPWTVAYEALPSMGFPRQEYWSGVPLPSLSMIQQCWQFDLWFLCLF